MEFSENYIRWICGSLFGQVRGPETQTPGRLLRGARGVALRLGPTLGVDGFSTER